MIDDKRLIDEAQQATKAIRTYLARKKLGDDNIAGYFRELAEEWMSRAVYYWAGYTYVGLRKQISVQNAFQSFYTELMTLLLAIRNKCINATEEEILFANAVLYEGVIYRYLGYGEPGPTTRKPIRPLFDNIYVSWSTEATLSPYMSSKLYGVKTLLTAETKGDYGINLARFNLTQQENEIVYPTHKESITNIAFVD